MQASIRLLLNNLRDIPTAKALFKNVEKHDDPMVEWCCVIGLPVCSECITFSTRFRAILCSAIANDQGIQRLNGTKYPEIAAAQLQFLRDTCNQLLTYDISMVTRLFEFMHRVCKEELVLQNEC